MCYTRESFSTFFFNTKNTHYIHMCHKRAALVDALFKIFNLIYINIRTQIHIQSDSHTHTYIRTLRHGVVAFWIPQYL